MSDTKREWDRVKADAFQLVSTPEEYLQLYEYWYHERNRMWHAGCLEDYKAWYRSRFEN